MTYFMVHPRTSPQTGTRTFNYLRMLSMWPYCFAVSDAFCRRSSLFSPTLFDVRWRQKQSTSVAALLSFHFVRQRSMSTSQKRLASTAEFVMLTAGYIPPPVRNFYFSHEKQESGAAPKAG